MIQIMSRSSPHTEPAQVSGEPTCTVTVMPISYCSRETSRDTGMVPTLRMSSGTASFQASSSLCTGLFFIIGAPVYLRYGNSMSPPNSAPPALAQPCMMSPSWP